MCTAVALRAEEKETYTADALLIGADAIGRGGSYIAGAGNSPLFQNFARQSALQFSFTAFKLLSELNYLSASYAQNGFGLGFLTMQDSAGYNRDENNNLTGGQINYSDSTIYAAYGFALDKLNLGLRLKYTTKSLGETANASGFALDLAALYSLNAYWSLGALLNNVPNTSSLRWSDGRTEIFAASGILGVKYSVFGEQNNLNLYTDLNFEKSVIFPSGGVEWRPAEMLALRGGLAQVYTWQDDRETIQLKPSAGLGLNLFGLFFDYAYSPDTELADSVTHFFTLSYIFGDLAANNDLAPEPEKRTDDAHRRQRIYKDIYNLSPEDQLDIEDLGYLNILPRDE
ncbi:hypothetical protein NO1_1128 [Candidatus Termititenax aidoneus]|uniref:Outer membrane protein n=1 Tax=Termititenax aidoneus TaxID=2218524 RepID=A0A388TAS2_TERA1|nr:hypothetical protein NO1_1128 [Candidatus Termititenax aidoneus]